jgi:hypothetical protein
MSISAEDLALGMLDARCTYGIHLDMNPGHAGFELYDVAPEGTLAPLGRPLQSDWEAEGKVPDMAGWVFRSRRMIRGMGHMLFPRYIQREQRDFFYLTARSILPGAPLDPPRRTEAPEPDEGHWRMQGLPQHGFPGALATTWMKVGETKLLVLRADPRTMKPAPMQPEAPTVLTLTWPASRSTQPPPVRGEVSLWWASGVFSVGVPSPTRDAARLLPGYASVSPSAARARAAVGVQDEDGMLVWVEVAPEAEPDARTAVAMDQLLERLGCSARMAVSDARILLGGTLDLAGAPAAAAPASAVRLVRAQAPDAHAFMTATPLVDVEVWRPLQAKRVRYFYKPAPSSSASPPASIPPGHSQRTQTGATVQPRTSEISITSQGASR